MGTHGISIFLLERCGSPSALRTFESVPACRDSMTCVAVAFSRIRSFWRPEPQEPARHCWSPNSLRMPVVTKRGNPVCLRGIPCPAAAKWHKLGIDFEQMEQDGLLKIICAYPESTGLGDHLQIKTEISQFKPSRMAIDSLSALARGVSHNACQFVIGVTGYAKQEEIAGFFTNTSEEFLGSHSITDSHISTITDTILLLQYVK